MLDSPWIARAADPRTKNFQSNLSQNGTVGQVIFDTFVTTSKTEEAVHNHRLKRLSLTATLAAVALTAVSGVATAAPGSSSIRMSPTASYNGGSIATTDAAAKGLSCIERADGSMACFDTAQQALGSSVAKSEAAKIGAAPTTSIARKNHKARAAAEVGANNPYMWITQDRLFNNNLNTNGWNIFGYARSNWYDMTGGYRNAASSVSAGNHSGYLSDSYQGGGLRWRVELNYDYGIWSPDNRADARYRN